MTLKKVNKMKIANKNVVNIKYTLTDNDNNIIDKSEDGNFSFLIGAGNIIKGLEDALIDKTTGDIFDVNIAPANAYGEYNKELIHKVPRTQFPPDMDIKADMQFQGKTATGQMTVVKVTDVKGEDVFIDNNHPLAGVELNFAVEVTNVREASSTELEHGHVYDSNEHCGNS
ncbi:FKBP-type peptidyl-prolyl cis-trans isomerase SlyD [hydrothermal vent metagenome]|uniref:peptidylprolyl isomerase n=1 Tax=hydrothermal vent metagenome TaxID=652676 RepID=A0A3B0VHC6_9ZZZZ